MLEKDWFCDWWFVKGEIVDCCVWFILVIISVGDKGKFFVIFEVEGFWFCFFSI